MASPQLYDAMQVQAWQKNMQKQIVLQSVWEQLSNRVEVSTSVPNAKGMDFVPDSVVINVSDDFNAGVKKVTIPFLGKLNQKGQFGRQKADGNEETPSMKYKSVGYNTERKSISLEEESLDGDLNRFYRIGNAGTKLLTDYFVELTDYNMQRATIEGASEALTEAAYFDGATVTSAVASKSYNPNVYGNGKSTKATYSATHNTFEGNIQTYVDSMTTASNAFDLQALESLVRIASKTVIPLKWRASGKEINWVALLSSEQIMQLQDSTAASSWATLMQAADVRGELNRAITGQVGVFRGLLIIEDPRSPLWNCAGTAGNYVGYVKPWSGGSHYNASDASVSRASKTGAGNGTLEIARVYGRSALGCAKVKATKFDEQTKDYNFYKGVCGARAEGTERMDFDIATATNTSKRNDTGFLYFSASPSVVY